MRAMHNASGSSRAGYPLFCLLAALALAAGCAGSPSAAPSETGEAPAADAEASAPVRPEVLEIRGPVPLPVRFAALLPDPEPPLRGARPSSPAMTAPPVPSLPAPEPPLPPEPSAAVAAPAVPETKAVAPSQSPVPAPKSAAPASGTAAAPSASKPAAASATDSTKSAASAPKSAAASGSTKSSAPASKSAAPASGTTGAPAASKPAEPLPPAPASSVRVVPEASPAAVRTEEAVRGAPLDLALQGSGWVYLGETGGREGIRYDSRKFDGSSAVFRFTADRPGEYQLRFQRQDPLSGDPENLLVEVTVREPESQAPSPAGAGTATSAQPASAQGAAAPSSAPSSPGPGGSASGASAAGTSGSGSAASAEAAVSPAPPSRELPSTPEELLRLAREDLAAGRIASVLEALDRYVALFPFGSDEAFYLYAKAYEQNTPYRDIKKAYANYRKVRDEWPRSSFWKDSSERAAYIERHYFDIR